MISTQDLLVVLAIAAVLFGAKKLPELGRGIGEAIKNFKKGMESNEVDVTPDKDKIAKEQGDKKEQAEKK